MICTILKAILFCAILVSTILAANKPNYDSSYVRFMTGVFLLNSTTTITNDAKAEKYGELVKITGIDSGTAVKYLSMLRQKPQECQQLFEQIKNELDAQRNSQSISSDKSERE